MLLYPVPQYRYSQPKKSKSHVSFTLNHKIWSYKNFITKNAVRLLVQILFNCQLASGVDSRVDVWVREFLVGQTQNIRIGGELSKEVKVSSGAPQGSVLGPLLFLVRVKNIWRNIDSNIRLFADECIIYRKITNKNDIRNFQKDLDTLRERAVENGMKINPGRRKTIGFTRAQVKKSTGLLPW